jgi:hypothetical protein
MGAFGFPTETETTILQPVRNIEKTRMDYFVRPPLRKDTSGTGRCLLLYQLNNPFGVNHEKRRVIGTEFERARRVTLHSVEGSSRDLWKIPEQRLRSDQEGRVSSADQAAGPLVRLDQE